RRAAEGMTRKERPAPAVADAGLPERVVADAGPRERLVADASVHERVVADARAAARELRTLRDLLRWAVSRFEVAALAYGHGTDNAWDEAVSLLLFALHLPPDRLDPYLDARLTRAEREAAIGLVERRVATRLP